MVVSENCGDVSVLLEFFAVISNGRGADRLEDIASEVYGNDQKLGIFRRFVNILEHCHPFRLKGYKEYIFLVGGVCVPSNAERNYRLLMYDSIKEIWKTKSRMPFRVRNFKTCIVGSKMFITGNRGHPHVMPLHMFWYDYETDEWSTRYDCPRHIRDISYKCCNYLDKFLIFSLNWKCACTFEETSGFTILPLVYPPTLDNDIKNMQIKCGKFSLFAYKDRLYLKGTKILEMKKIYDGLEVIFIKTISTVKYDDLETTICDNMVYTLYREHTIHGYMYSFEKFNLDTHEMEIIFDGLKTLQVEEKLFNLDQRYHSLNIFSVSHHNLFDENELVNKNF
ncbi:uncharacterized protein LOC114327589 [Diabrotica virgifera virgifera]|uniref:Uncharacterized protein n=1 Tax=Diabrotica virgifera virgifera TaxID=50390 RepID=A0ABM5L798_DIAVI|nr:uncharacterized protein LOC114327589 [Diabrotica virgifera virgifera]